MVEAFCRRHGYPYRTLGWGEALWKSYLTFWRPKPVRTDLEAHSVMLATAVEQTHGRRSLVSH